MQSYSVPPIYSRYTENVRNEQKNLIIFNLVIKNSIELVIFMMCESAYPIHEMMKEGKNVI